MAVCRALPTLFSYLGDICLQDFFAIEERAKRHNRGQFYIKYITSSLENANIDVIKNDARLSVFTSLVHTEA